MKYRTFDYADRMESGRKITIEHIVSVEDVSPIDENLSLQECRELLNKAREAEENAYEDVRVAAKNWESAALQVVCYEKIIKWLKTTPPKHTANKWVKDENDVYECSNMVYTMTYQISEYKTFNVRWSIYTTRINYENPIYKIAAQERKFKTLEEAEKYIQGRIRAYSHLFAEISPLVPEEYTNAFKVSGLLIKGYRRQENDVEK